MEVLDILSEISDRGRLRNIIVGGYVKKELRQPPIFSTEELDSNGKFVDLRIIYATDERGKRLLSSGNVVAFVPKDLEIKDFYEFRGTLSLGGFDYTRVVTMMVFNKRTNETLGKTVWQVSPVIVSDIELSHLNKKLYDEVMSFVQAPLSYENKDLDYILKPISEEVDSNKVYYNFKGFESSSKLRPKSTKDTREFESANNYLIDDEYEIIREALRFPVIAVNISDFGNDRILLRYMSWLVNESIVFVEGISEVLDNSKHYVILSNKDIDDIPYLELRKGLLF